VSEAERAQRYRELGDAIVSVLAPDSDPISAMATVACLLKAELLQASWVGFYRVVAPDLLRVGPYQGPLGCLEIAFERGVCGAAARQRLTQLVPDVAAFPGHIACDEAARSELVVPVDDERGELVAVLDLDSHQVAAFDEVDARAVEALLARLRPYFTSPPSRTRGSSPA